MKKGWPSHIKQLFWGDDLVDLSFNRHRGYIIQTILEKGDIDDVKWLFQQVPPDDIKKNLKLYRLSPKSAVFWKMVL